MNPHHGREFARPQEPVMPAILRGDAWRARRIRANCLRQHCHALATTFRRRKFTSLKADCARVFFVLETRSRVLTEIHPTELAIVAGVARLGAYSDQWLRQPEVWWPDPNADARAQWADLLRHLLARYAVPSFLDHAWEIPGTLQHFERDCWCALAQGRSLRDVAGFPRSIRRRVLHAALNSVDGMQRGTLAEAIWVAQLSALNASRTLVAEVFSSRIRFELGDYPLWARLAAKFTAKSDAPASQFGFVAEVLVVERAHRGTSHVQQLLKLPLATIICHCVRFATGLLNANGQHLTNDEIREPFGKGDLYRFANSRWQPLLGPVPFASTKGRVGEHAVWRVEELSSIDALRNEGHGMRHCVGMYAHRCRTGSSAIFSVRRYVLVADTETQATSCATIEVHRGMRKVVQVRAYRNRPVNNTVMSIVHEWAAANGLVCTV
jgi:hypothetical protein